MDQLKINSRGTIAKLFKSESLETFSVFGMSKRLDGRHDAGRAGLWHNGLKSVVQILLLALRYLLTSQMA